MKVLEFEAKALLRELDLRTPHGAVARNADAASAITQQFNGPTVLKAQIPTGGRMKAGGIQFVHSPDEAAEAAQTLFNNKVLGFVVDRVLVEEELDIVAELFIAVTYDDDEGVGVVLASLAGGIDVESADGFVRCSFPQVTPVPAQIGREVARQLGGTGSELVALGRVISRLVDGFIAWDALLLEVNPLVHTSDGRWVIADVHLELDDDAAYRQRKIRNTLERSLKADNQRSEFERKAIEIDNADHRGVAGRLIAFEGDLGLLIGGGGASLTIFDAVLDAGLNPANYCEIGGNPSVWKVAALTKLILSQPNVKYLAVIMNIVSNTRADLVARGVIKGILELGRVPKEVITAFRVPGSWEDESKHILEHYEILYFGRESTIDNVVDAISWPS